VIYPTQRVYINARASKNVGKDTIGKSIPRTFSPALRKEDVIIFVLNLSSHLNEFNAALNFPILVTLLEYFGGRIIFKVISNGNVIKGLRM
jgi:hypothetical protein